MSRSECLAVELSLNGSLRSLCFSFFAPLAVLFLKSKITVAVARMILLICSGPKLSDAFECFADANLTEQKKRVCEV